MILVLRTPYTSETVHLDGDGIVDEIYHYRGQVLESTERDRNADRKIDLRWLNDFNGIPVGYESDDDFDGVFEWTGEVERGDLKRAVEDSDRDGRPESVQVFVHGVLRTHDIYEATGSHVVARETFDNAMHVSTEFDKDGDGVFERRVDYDGNAEPVASRR